MKSAFFWCYPWDLLDEGVEAALDRMVGEAGVDAISVATTYHQVAQFRPHPDVAPRRWSSDAAAHFQPAADKYANTRVRPLPAAWMKARNPLALIAAACERRGVGLRAWTVGCHGDALVERYPTAACKDVFGERSASWLCPANPDVREYVAALADDLSTNYPLAAIELESADFGWPHAQGHEKTGLAIGPIERWLLGLCFCESCGQLAARNGIDTGMVRRSVQVHLDATLAGRAARGQPLDDFLQRDEPLEAYLEMRRAAVTTLLESVAARSRVPLIVHAPFDATLSAVDLAAVSRHADAVVLPAFAEDETAGAARLATLRHVFDGPSRLERGFFCGPPHTTAAPDLTRSVHDAASAGHDTVGFYQYGITPLGCLDWVRQALRFARRETTGKE